VALKQNSKQYMMNTMKYLRCEKQNQVSILDMEMPKPAPGEISVRMVMCGVCGTDTAKVFGDYAKPQKLGHEVVGVVEALGQGVTRFQRGQRVALAHHAADHTSHYAKRGSETMDPVFKTSNIDPGGFSEFIRVPALLVENTVVAIPDHVPDTRAVFMEPMACCLRALDRVKLVAGDSCLVVGAGAVGMLFMPLLRDLGVKAVAADMRAERIAVAKTWGAVAGGVPGTDDIAALCKQQSDGRGVDCVVLTIVNAATVALALAAVRDGGTVVIFGGKPGAEFPLPMWDIWLREINLITSYSATPDGLRRAMTILSGQHYIGLEKLISHQMPLAQAQAAFELVFESKASKAVLTA
jgi:L-iditol 2-dehydrogenase